MIHLDAGLTKATGKAMCGAIINRTNPVRTMFVFEKHPKNNRCKVCMKFTTGQDLTFDEIQKMHAEIKRKEYDRKLKPFLKLAKDIEPFKPGKGYKHLHLHRTFTLKIENEDGRTVVDSRLVTLCGKEQMEIISKERFLLANAQCRKCLFLFETNEKNLIISTSKKIIDDGFEGVGINRRLLDKFVTLHSIFEIKIFLRENGIDYKWDEWNNGKWKIS
jgi:hypothetical protein